MIRVISGDMNITVSRSEANIDLIITALQNLKREMETEAKKPKPTATASKS